MSRRPNIKPRLEMLLALYADRNYPGALGESISVASSTLRRRLGWSQQQVAAILQRLQHEGRVVKVGHGLWAATEQGRRFCEEHKDILHELAPTPLAENHEDSTGSVETSSAPSDQPKDPREDFPAISEDDGVDADLDELEEMHAEVADFVQNGAGDEQLRTRLPERPKPPPKIGVNSSPRDRTSPAPEGIAPAADRIRVLPPDPERGTIEHATLWYVRVAGWYGGSQRIWHHLMHTGRTCSEEEVQQALRSLVKDGFIRASPVSDGFQAMSEFAQGVVRRP